MAIFDFSKKAVLWDLDDTLHSRREAVRRVFPGMFRACLYTDRSEAFIDEAVSYIMTQITGKTMMDADAFRALLARYPSDKPYIRKDCIDYYYAQFFHLFPLVLQQIFGNVGDDGHFHTPGFQLFQDFHRLPGRHRVIPDVGIVVVNTVFPDVRLI